MMISARRRRRRRRAKPAAARLSRGADGGAPRPPPYRLTTTTPARMFPASSPPQSVWDAVSRLLPRVEWEEARRALGVTLIEQNASLSAEAAALSSIVSAADADAGAAGSAGFERNTLAAQVAFFVEGLASSSGASSRALLTRGSRARSSDGLSSAGSCTSLNCSDAAAVDLGGASAAARSAVDAFASAADENGKGGGGGAHSSWLWADAATLEKLREALNQEAAALADDIEYLRARLLSHADVRAALPAASSDAASLAALRARKAELQHRWIALEAERELGGSVSASTVLTKGALRCSDGAAAEQGAPAAGPPSRAALKLHKALARGDAADDSGRIGTRNITPAAAIAGRGQLSHATTAAPAPTNSARVLSRGAVAGVLRVRGAQHGGEAQTIAARESGAVIDDDERFFS